MTADVQWSLSWIRDVAARVSERKSEFTTLDREIGDADHGENLNRGFTAVVERLDGLEQPPGTIGDVLKLVATTLMSTVGGASGPLYGTAFLRASKAAAVPELDGQAASALISAALEGVSTRGKAVVGEKTMIDAWAPAAAAAAQSAENGEDAAQVFAAAAQAAAQGAEETIELKATKGRASYLGERSVGHKDPGATTTALILESAARTVQ
jgi:dihydroxyacetone kinase-like protein